MVTPHPETVHMVPAGAQLVGSATGRTHLMVTAHCIHEPTVVMAKDNVHFPERDVEVRESGEQEG